MSGFPEPSLLEKISMGAGIASAATNVGSGLFNLFGARRRRQIQFRREDNAVRRRATDLEAAGLSKTLAAGGAAQASTPIFPGDKNVDVGDLTNAMMARENRKMIQQNINTSKSQERVNDMQKNKLGVETLGVMEENLNKKIKNEFDLWKFAQTSKESRYFDTMGLPMLYQVPGITGEASRLLSSFWKATAGSGPPKAVVAGIKKAGQMLDGFNGSVQEANARIDQVLKGVPGFVGETFQKTKDALIKAWELRNVRSGGTQTPSSYSVSDYPYSTNYGR